MSQRLDIGIYDRASGARLLIPTWRARGCTFRTNAHGFADCRLTLPLTRLRAYQLYDGLATQRLLVQGGGSVAYDGRIEDVGLTDEGLQITAYGYWRALSDAPYTALWSDTQVGSWRALNENDNSIAAPDRFKFDSKDRLYVTPQKGASHGSSPFIMGYWGYATPDGGSRQITHISFDYEIVSAGTDYLYGLQRMDSNWTYVATEWAGTTTGTVSGSQSLTLSGAADRVVFYLCRGAANANVTDETGDNYLQITNLRVLTQAAPVEADDIARDIAAAVASLNSTQLSSATSQISSPGLDLRDECYLDEYPADILDRLAALGDSSGNTWEVGVYEDRRLFLRQRGSAGRQYFVDATALEVQRTLEALRNSAYAVYEDASDVPVRSAATADSGSVTRYGLTRRQAVSVRTTDSTQAALVRATALNDAATPRPRASLAFRQIYTASGGAVPPWVVRSGDAITIRNLPPGGEEVERIRSFIVAETAYSVDDGTLELAPEAPRPTLDVLLARQARGLA